MINIFLTIIFSLSNYLYTQDRTQPGRPIILLGACSAGAANIVYPHIRPLPPAPPDSEHNYFTKKAEKEKQKKSS